MTVQVHYGGVRYSLRDRDVKANAIAVDLGEIIARGDEAEPYRFDSDEGSVTIFPARGAVAVLEVPAPRRMPPPPAPAVLPRDPRDGPSIRDVQF